MALLGARRGDRDQVATHRNIASRLLPEVLKTERLEALGTLNILDFGRAYSGSLELFNQFSCRLCVLDAADSLLGWSTRVAERAAEEEPPSPELLLRELTQLLPELKDYRFDVVFLWDTLNHLHPIALAAFRTLLFQHMSPQARGHGFILHKRDVPQRQRSMGLGGLSEIRLLKETDVPLYVHTRKQVNESLAPELAIDHAVLHGDGRLEYILTVSNSYRG